LKRLDASDIKNAGSFLSRELKQILPNVYEKKYAPLWAEQGMYIPAAPTLEEGVESISEEIVESVGEAVELSDLTDDFPTSSSSIREFDFNAHTFIAGYSYTVLQLKAWERAGRNISAQRIAATDRALRQKVHELALFGSKKRGSKGLYNNPDVPVGASGYNPNTSSWQDDIDFIAETISLIQDRNELTEDIGLILVPNKLRRKWTTKYQSQDSGKTVIQAIEENHNIMIAAVNESRADILNKYGILPDATKDRLIFLPQSSDALERLYFPPGYMPPQLIGMSYKVCAYIGSSETIVHYPEAMQYEDVPKVV
jgi:hypothetical protein